MGFRDPPVTQIALALWQELEQVGPRGEPCTRTRRLSSLPSMSCGTVPPAG